MVKTELQNIDYYIGEIERARLKNIKLKNQVDSLLEFVQVLSKKLESKQFNGKLIIDVDLYYEILKFSKFAGTEKIIIRFEDSQIKAVEPLDFID